MSATAAAHSRARWTIYLLGAGILLNVAAVASDYAQLELIGRLAAGANVPEADIDASDTRQSLIVFGQLALAIVTAIVAFMWVHAANRAARELGAGEMQFTPGWAVGWFFVPIANFFQPYRVVNELWKASDPERPRSDSTAWKHAPSPPLIAGWWIALIVEGVLSRVISIAGDDTIEELQRLTQLYIAADALGILTAFLAIQVVRGIDRRQQASEAAGPGSPSSVSAP